MQLLSLNENESTSASYCPPLVCCMQLQSIPQDAYIKRKRWRRKSHIGRYRTKQREGKMLAAGLISAVMLPWLMSLIKNSLERLCTAAKRGKGGIRATDATMGRTPGLDGVCNWIFCALIFSKTQDRELSPSYPAKSLMLQASCLLCFLSLWLHRTFNFLVRTYFTHQLMISRLNWHIRNMRARQLGSLSSADSF